MRRIHRQIRALATAAALAAALPSAAQVNAEQVLNIGRNVLSMDDYLLSIQYFNQAIKAKPYLADPYFFRALAKLNLEDYKGAETDCTLALERNRYKVEAYKLRGFARQNMGLDSLAIADYDAGLRFYPEDKYFLFYKAVALTATGSYERGDSTFATLLRLYPRFGEGFSARGRLNAMRGDTTAALADIERSLELTGTLPNPYLMRAEILSRRHEWDAALADMDEAIKLQPQEPDFYLNRAYLRYNKDDFFGAMSDYNYALELEPDNTAALFNRALLRYEVKDLGRAEKDLAEVLRLDPSNFHARYNHGLVLLELRRPKEALSEFQSIRSRYPRFHPAHYAVAEALRDMGDMRGAVAAAREGERLVKLYVTDPDRNPLDKPAIAAGDANRLGNDDEQLTETEVMDKFNRLVTVAASSEPNLTYNERIKGHVQDRDVRVEPQPAYGLTFFDTDPELSSLPYYFRDLDELNQRRGSSRRIYLSPKPGAPADDVTLKALFADIGRHTDIINSGAPRAVDYLNRGITYLLLKNYDAAMSDFDSAIAANPDFTVAYMARAYTRGAKTHTPAAAADDSGRLPDTDRAALAASIADYDTALRLDPRLMFAWFNKGNIHYEAGDMTSAMQCYTEAIAINPQLGAAYFNRGLAYLQMGNRQPAFDDLSKAGELGVLQSYNLLKRMK